MRNNPAMHRIAVLTLPHVVAFDLAIPLQVFGHGDRRDHYRVDVVAEEPVVPTTTGYGITRTAPLSALRRADTVIVPGFFPFGATPAALTALRRADDRGARMVSICTGAFALAEAGILAGRRATTHWHHTAQLAAFAGTTVDADVLYVDEGRVLTSAGVAAGIDLCLHILRLDHGVEAAAGVARRMVVAPHRDGGQAQYLDRPLPTSGASLAATCAWAVTRLDEPLTVQELARHAGYAPRTFARRFLAETGVTPLTWLTSQRLALARRLLETTDEGVDRVAERSGLGSAANLRMRLHRDAGVSPSAYRATFRGRMRTGDESPMRTGEVSNGGFPNSSDA